MSDEQERSADADACPSAYDDGHVPASSQGKEVVRRPGRAVETTGRSGVGPPDWGGRLGEWWRRPRTMLIVVVLVLVLIAVAAVLALRGPGTVVVQSTPEPGSVTRTVTATPSPTDRPTSPGQSRPESPPEDRPVTPADGTRPEPEPGRLPPPGSGGVFQTGQFEMGIYDAHFDLDVNDELAGPGAEDVAVTGYGLFTANGAILTPVSSKRPQPKVCAGISIAKWRSEIVPDDIRVGRTYCLLTDADRYGYLTIRGRDVTSGGRLKGLAFSFTVWEGPDD